MRLDDVSVVLAGRPVLHGTSAAFAPGTLTGVIGPNGAGKSTLVRAMLSLVPYAGSITIDGDDVSGIARRLLARRISYLPQGQTLHWPLSVERLVSLGRLPHLAPMSRMSDADLAAIERAMERTDVIALRHRIATELSGGERARVMLARALAVGAPALVADEPLASLDPGHQIDVMDLLRTEARNGMLVVAVLHDLAMAARYCDTLLLIDAGSIAAAGDPATVLTPGNLRTVYGIEARIDTSGDWPSLTVLGRRQA